MAIPSNVLYTAYDVFPMPKGSSTHIHHFTQGLTAAGYAVTVAVRNNGLQAETEQYDGITIRRFDVNSFSATQYLARTASFGAAIHQFALQMFESGHPYTIVHSRSAWEGLQLASLKKELGYKFIFELNGLPSIELKYYYPLLAQTDEGKRLLANLHQQEMATLMLSDAIICVSETTQNFLIQRGIPKERIHLIRNGVDVEQFKSSSLPVRSNQRIPVLLYQGIPAAWQGLETLIRAMPKVLMVQKVVLRIVGARREDDYTSLQKLVEQLNIGEFVQFENAVSHDEMPNLISKADVCIAPLAINDRNLIQGCCPLKILEYMSCGRPTIASNLPVTRELLRDGIDGLLFIADNPDDLARKILYVLSEDRVVAERLAQNASARIRSNFTWDIANRKLVDLYAQLLSSGA